MPNHVVAAAASFLGTIESFDAKQLAQGSRVLEVRCAKKQSAVLPTDFVPGDITFPAAAPNALLRDELLNSVVVLWTPKWIMRINR